MGTLGTKAVWGAALALWVIGKGTRNAAPAPMVPSEPDSLS